MRALLLALLVGVAAGPAAAQDHRAAPRVDALDWLAGEPMTLLDWGIARLRGDLDYAAAEAAQGGRSTLARSGAFYRPQDRRIVAYANFVEPAANRTEAVCVELFGRVAGALVRGAPQGSGGASWYLESVFGHEARGANRPPELGEQMADRVALQVTLGARAPDAFEDPRRVTCTGRLDSPPAGIALRVEG
ncbi:hypothetical protein [Azospirillum doebereinerae]|uniref:Uncharacterized protein n=1 Tax=Azospirillum doebereinerae TaxID=92933 RepID=A0A3S0WYU3_9PROT|nr:hypothetical protein [Azospirillum doebereinerae]RUQ70194.1 hypothetical protein EJ913_14445 [Azospirillum doebereinerae]